MKLLQDAFPGHCLRHKANHKADHSSTSVKLLGERVVVQLEALFCEFLRNPVLLDFVEALRLGGSYLRSLHDSNNGVGVVFPRQARRTDRISMNGRSRTGEYRDGGDESH